MSRASALMKTATPTPAGGAASANALLREPGPYDERSPGSRASRAASRESFE